MLGMRFPVLFVFLQFIEDMAEIRGLVAELSVFVEYPIAIGDGAVDLIDETTVDRAKTGDLRLKFVEMPLLTHARSAGGFSVGDHPTTSPLFHLKSLLLMAQFFFVWMGVEESAELERRRHGAVLSISRHVSCGRQLHHLHSLSLSRLSLSCLRSLSNLSRALFREGE